MDKIVRIFALKIRPKIEIFYTSFQELTTLKVNLLRL